MREPFNAEIGKWVDSGLYNSDINSLGGIVQGVCYNNAKEYFKSLVFEDECFL